MFITERTQKLRRDKWFIPGLSALPVSVQIFYIRPFHRELGSKVLYNQFPGAWQWRCLQEPPSSRLDLIQYGCMGECVEMGGLHGSSQL